MVRLHTHRGGDRRPFSCPALWTRCARPPAAPGSVESVRRGSFPSLARSCLRGADAPCSGPVRKRYKHGRTDGRGSRCQRSKSIPKINTSRNGALEPLPRGSLRSGGGKFLEKFPAHISRLTQALFPLEFKQERREDKLRLYVLPRPQTAAKLKLYDKKNLRLVCFLNSEISSRCLHIK